MPATSPARPSTHPAPTATSSVDPAPGGAAPGPTAPDEATASRGRARPEGVRTPPAAADGECHDGLVVIALPAGAAPTWVQVSRILQWHGITAALPVPQFPVRHHGLPGLVTRWTRAGLLAPVRHHGVVRRAGGGRLARLDLHHVVEVARRDATARWWQWKQHIADTTPQARGWEQFLAEHRAGRVSWEEAARRFHAQPRVLAMLAYNSYPYAPCHLAVDELAAYQAGLTVYTALHWQRPLIGDALVTPWGQLLRPASGSVAAKLRYLTTATQVVHRLTPTDHLIAVHAALPPSSGAVH